MNTRLDRKFFISSGLNEKFYGDDLSFAEYIEQTRTMVTNARIDLHSENRQQIVAANSPFEWLPTHLLTKNKHQRGILLVHGLSDSPFILMDMGRVFAANGFVVRSILLPGHGTVPGDLLNVNHKEWSKAVKYGVTQFKNKVDDIFIVGFSTGGALAINLALDEPDLSGLILIAPAIRLHRQMIISLIKFYQPINWLIPGLRWVEKVPQQDYSKYESFTLNAVNQTYQVIETLQQKLSTASVNMPLFIVVSADDEVVCPKATLKFFQQNKHRRNNLLIYGDKLQSSEKITGVEYCNSQFPEQKIVDFSHVGLTISPNNRHYGINGDYQDFLHYPDLKPPSNRDIYLGAPTKENLKKYVIQRLRYNPDFDGMMMRILAFLTSIQF